MENNNINILNRNNYNKTKNITENDQKLCNDLIAGKNSAKNEINGKNLLLLNNINLNKINRNNINYSDEFINEEEIKENNDLFEDLMKQKYNSNFYNNKKKL